MKNDKSINKFFVGFKRAMLSICLAMLLVMNMIPTGALEIETPINLDQNIDLEELECFVDEQFNENMNEYNIPGGVISIVKDGKIILSKGYGYADQGENIPVVPSSTLFRIGSVTKIFTANASMQLVEKGEIDLNMNVNYYLQDFSLENPYPEEITMAQLLTHTSGIDNDVIGDLSKIESEIIPVSQFLKKRMLPVVNEPGQYIQYSSYGMALAGCIVEEVSGMNCSDYIYKNILEPLEMINTSFAMNLPELAQGYISTGDENVPQELNGYFNLYPVGGILSTAEDMANFMIAHLNNGEYKGCSILGEDTAIDMHSRHSSFDPLLPGVCYGFYERFIDGVRTIGHAGYSPDGFSTELSLLKDYNIGIFISVNQGSNNSFPQNFVNEFIGHYFPVVQSDFNNMDTNGLVDNRIEGTYRFGDYTRSTLNKGDLFGSGQDVRVHINDERTITLYETDPYTRVKKIIVATQVFPLKFKTSEGEYVVFKQDKEGKIKYMAQTSDSWHGTYERINWYDENFFQIGTFIGGIFIFLFEIIVCTVWLFKQLMKKNTKGGIDYKSNRVIRLLHGIGALFNIAFYGISMMTWGERLRYGVPLDVKLLLILPIATCLIYIILAILSFLSWKNRMGSLFFRINTTVATLAGLIFIWFYNYYNLLGFKY